MPESNEEMLRRTLGATRIQFRPAPEIAEIVLPSHQRVFAELARVLAFEFKEPSFILGIETLVFEQRQLFRFNSAGHMRGAVDFFLSKQRWTFNNLNINPHSLDSNHKFEEVARAISAALGKDYLIIVERTDNLPSDSKQRWELQYLNGVVNKNWFLNDRNGSKGDHVHIQPQSDQRIRKYIAAEKELFEAVVDLENAESAVRDSKLTLGVATERQNRAAVEAQQARVRESEAEAEAVENARQNRIEKEEAEQKAKDRVIQAQEAHDKAVQNEEKAKEKAEKKKDDRDANRLTTPPLLREVQDDDSAGMSLAELTMLILKSVVHARPDILTRQDAEEGYQKILKELQDLINSIRIVSDIEDYQAGWKHEDPEEMKRHIEEFLKYMAKPAPTDLKEDLPWCGNGFIHNVYLALGLVTEKAIQRGAMSASLL